MCYTPGRITHSGKVRGGSREEATSGPPTATWLECHLRISEDGIFPLPVPELQVVPALLWLHFVYLAGCCPGPVPPLGAHPTLLLAGTEAAEMCVLWAAASLPGTADASLRVTAPRMCEVRASGSADVARALHSQGVLTGPLASPLHP